MLAPFQQGGFVSVGLVLSLFASHVYGAALPFSSTTPDVKALEPRQGPLATVGELVDIASGVGETINNVIQFVGDINAKQHQAESDFTGGMVSQLRRTYPDKNVIVYHNGDSQASFDSNAVHSHYELDIGLGMTQGYEIWVLDSGTFNLAGDEGPINWCLSGGFVRDGTSSFVTFNTISPPSTSTNPPPPSSPPVPPPTPSRAYPSDTDGNYFVNCQNRVDGTVSSGMAYYSNLDPGQNAGQQPDDYIAVVHGQYTTWETPGQVTFNSGVTVHWQIWGTVRENQPNDSAGAADNGYEYFWVYNDAGEWLYSIDDWDCSSIYYAF